MLETCALKSGLPGAPSLTPLTSCATRLPTVACADLEQPFFGLLYLDTCPDLLEGHGTFAGGHVCDFAEQCAGGVCQGTDDGGCGTCAPAAAASEPCSATSPCGAGLRCDSTKVCVPASNAGEACASDSPRECTGSLLCSSGHCVASRPTAGQPCDDGGACHGSLICAQGTCKVGPDVGATCLAGDPDNGDVVCMPGLECRSGHCEVPAAPSKEVGQTCTQDPDCKTYRCLDAMCAPAPGVLGATCDDTLDSCELGLVCHAGVCSPPTAACTY